MKRFILVLLILAAIFSVAFTPLPQAEPGELPSGLVVILSSVLIPMVVQGLKWIAAWAGVVWKEKTLMIICFVLGVGVAFLWLRPIFPAFPLISGDPAEFAGLILDWVAGALSVVGSVFGLATFVYQFILRSVFDALGFGNQQISFLAYKTKA